jgi:hypothetical protein
MIHYRVMKERLCNKFGPNSQKDAEETRRKLEGLHGDHRGWDIYLAALDTLVKVLSKTPVRDTANNPVLQPVPVRPHLPVPPITATLADFLAYENDDANAQRAWEVRNPNDKHIYESLPNRHRHQELRHASSRIVNLRTILEPRPTIPTERPCQQDLERPAHGH